jgi:predicted DNA-binding transcriptional regulator YafY
LIEVPMREMLSTTVGGSGSITERFTHFHENDPLVMSRAERFLQLMQLLRGYKHSVQGKVLADALGNSIRTLYRDIASLQAQGADIDGEPGVGYVLRPGFVLPPLMFSRDEIEALVLGSRWVAGGADADLAIAAQQVLVKVAAVLPAKLRIDLETSPLLVGPSAKPADDDNFLGQIRLAIRGELKISISYRDAKGKDSDRVIWPFAVGFFEKVRVIVAWCERRAEYRHFRTDRIQRLTMTEETYPRRRLVMLKEWKSQEGVSV